MQLKEITRKDVIGLVLATDMKQVSAPPGSRHLWGKGEGTGTQVWIHQSLGSRQMRHQ